MASLRARREENKPVAPNTILRGNRANLGHRIAPTLNVIVGALGGAALRVLLSPPVDP
jgi:hypothetical protein